MKNKTWDISEILKPELLNLEKRLDKSIKWVEEHKNEIHPSISFIQSVELYDMGIDVTQLNPIMNGILEKKEDGWFVRWSDLHSFSYGTHWMWTPIHPSEIVDETKYKDGDEVEFEMVTTGYDEENFTPFRYVKLSKQK